MVEAEATVTPAQKQRGETENVERVIDEVARFVADFSRFEED
ncbi:MAG: hypothetical protein SVX38_00375 [Chloroflexota bacterium]|nr:hypothetical protein [Chloroflexota bacterium]